MNSYLSRNLTGGEGGCLIWELELTGAPPLWPNKLNGSFSSWLVDVYFLLKWCSSSSVIWDSIGNAGKGRGLDGFDARDDTEFNVAMVPRPLSIDVSSKFFDPFL